ncbi:Serpin (serine protease inhibitor) [uncultured archaeon]|nr:Serpin (serine protease inhibitor) [uncultured archaeon]
MTYEGAKGKTAEEMASVLHFPKDLPAMRSGFQAINSYLNAPGKDYRLSVANALWAEQGYAFLPAYLAAAESYYGGKATNLDFIGATEASRATINSWVENQTNGRIKDLIPQGAISSDTRLVLTNAIYFKGTWVEQFNEELTKEEDFRKSASSTVKAQMMHQEASFNYAENSQLQILQMPYAGTIRHEEYGDIISAGNLSMVIVLPKNDDLSSLENSLSSQKLSEWQSQLQEQKVDVSLPKFKFESKYMMADDLKVMGMPTAFNPDAADFSGMDGTRDLFISQVIHQAYVDVSENGTEAAAATAVIMAATGMPVPQPAPPVFRADHPFIFLIEDKGTGTILFMGRFSG